MAQARIDISNSVLSWAAAQLKFDSLPEKIREYLRQWIDGEKLPTFKQLEEVSKSTGIPFGYFFLSSPPEEDLTLAEYRTVGSKGAALLSRDLIDTQHDMELIQEWLREQLISDGAAPLKAVGSFKADAEPRLFAEGIRRILGLKKDWYSDSKDVRSSFKIIRSALNEVGVFVMMNGIVGGNNHRRLDIEEFRAFTLIDEYAPLIFINGADSYSGRLFSLLHEFAHVCLGESSLYNDRMGKAERVSHTEQLCNAAAAEILVPRSVFLEKWDESIKADEAEAVIDSLAKEFHCGNTVVARRALDCGKITSELYNKIFALAVKNYKDKKKGGGGDYYRSLGSRIDRRFLRMLINSLSEGKTLYSDAFRMTHTNRSTFMGLVKETEAEEL